MRLLCCFALLNVGYDKRVCLSLQSAQINLSYPLYRLSLNQEISWWVI